MVNVLAVTLVGLARLNHLTPSSVLFGSFFDNVRLAGVLGDFLFVVALSIGHVWHLLFLFQCCEIGFRVVVIVRGFTTSVFGSTVLSTTVIAQGLSLLPFRSQLAILQLAPLLHQRVRYVLRSLHPTTR